VGVKGFVCEALVAKEGFDADHQNSDVLHEEAFGIEGTHVHFGTSEKTVTGCGLSLTPLGTEMALFFGRFRRQGEESISLM
jgi:hypothetical protein